MTALVWFGILICISQSAMFSGLNLAFFSVSRLRLEVEKSQGNAAAAKVLKLRENANFLLTTILLGNVGINVLLTLLSNQVLAGVGAFLFSTVFITLLGEIIPQSYFARHALRTASMLIPVLRLYQLLLFPFVKPIALLLDKWLGREGVLFYKEHELMEMIGLHMKDSESDIDEVEGRGALNFLCLDDMAFFEEGETVDPRSILLLPVADNLPVFPEFSSNPDDPFLNLIQRSGKKWVIITDNNDKAHLALDADNFLREVLFSRQPLNPLHFCHNPIVISDPKTPFEEVISQLKVVPQRTGDDVIDQDLILLWGQTKKVITGADILGRLLRGIASVGHPHSCDNATKRKRQVGTM
ncbi:MAG: CNNM domain-containing protein [Desulforhopalus sp.]